MARLGTETAFEVLAAAKALEARGRHIVHLEIGEPDFDTPRHIVEAGIRALEDGWTHYSPAAGILELRQAIAADIASTRGIEVDPDEVVVTPGAKPIIFFSLLALAEKDDEVIYPNPGFPIYESMIEYCGARPVPMALREALDFRIDIQELIEAVTDRTRMIILNSPSNPAGSVMSRDDVAQLAAFLSDRDVTVLSDEVYSHMLYDEEHVTIAAFPGMKERTILMDGFSKTYAMTGWRMGYGVMRADLAEQITKLQINSNSCNAGFTQQAGIAALTGDHEPVRRMVETFRQRRDRMVELLNSIEGVSCRTPRGAFYVFPNISGLGTTSRDFQDILLEEGGVASLAGTAFGEFGEGYLRLSYAASMEDLEEGMRRLEDTAGKVLVG